MNTYTQARKRRFVATSIHEQVNDVVQFTITRGVVSLVVGRPGNGKTTSIEHIHEADPNAVMIEYAARFRTSKGLNRAFMDACGWYYVHRNAFDLDVAAEACARDCVQRGRYLLVDEYQNFELQAIRDLLRLNDKFDLPIVLVGNFTRLRSTKADAHTLEQITSRIWKKVKLDNPVRQDFIEMGVEFNVEGKAAYEELVVLGHNNNLRELVHVLEVARDLRGPTGSLNVEHLREAVDFLTGGATKNLGIATAGLRTVR